MYMNQKQRNKIYSRMKQENSLLSMEFDKNNYETKNKSIINNDISNEIDFCNNQKKK